MSLDQQLHRAIPTHTQTLDHEELQRRGRRRRWGQRVTAGLGGTAGIVVAASLALSPGTMGVDVLSSDGGAGGTGHAQERQADPDTVAAWEGLSHGEALTRLDSVLDDHPARPDDLGIVMVYGFPDGQRVSMLAPDTPELAVVDVSNDAFVADGTFDAVALLPTWTQDAARKALDSLRLSHTFRYAGVVVDPQDRTVLAFESDDAVQQIWIDPRSGYTVGGDLGPAASSGPAAPEPRTAQPDDGASGDTPTPAGG